MDKKDLYEIVPELDEKKETKKKKTKKKMTRKNKRVLITSLVSTVSVLVIAAGIIIGVPIYKEMTREPYSHANMPMLYITANPDLKFYNTDTKETTVLSSALFGKHTDSPYAIFDITEDGNTVFFLDDMGDLYYKDLNSEKTNRFIAENVSDFKADRDGTLLFLTGEGVLRLCKFKSDGSYKFTDIDNGVTAFWYGENGKSAAYIKEDALYATGFGFFSKPRLILEDYGEMAHYSENLEDIYLLKTDDGGKKSVTYVKNLKTAVSAVSGADEIYSYGEKGTVLYGVRTGEYLDLTTFFSDSLSESDKELPEPDFADLLYGNVTGQQFETAEQAWIAKLNRDSIRDMLKEESEKTQSFEIYKFEDGRNSKIDSGVTSIKDYNDDLSVVLYTSAKYKNNGETRGDISQFSTADDAYGTVLSILAEGDISYKVSMKGIDSLKTVYHHEKEITDAFMREDSTGVYVYERTADDETGVLKYIDIALGNVGSPKEISTALAEEPTLKDGNIIINEKTEETVETYFIDGIAKTFIDENVLASSVRKNESGSIVYTRNVVDGAGELILKSESGENGIVNKIADGVLSCYYRADNEVYYLTTIRARGYILNYYNGTETKAIDEEVINIINFK